VGLLIIVHLTQMRHVAAYLLAVLGGKANPTVEDVKKILNSVGAEADDAKLAKLVSELQGKNVNEVLAAGRNKLSAVPSAPAASAAPAKAAPAASAAPAKQEAPKKEEKPKEPSEEPASFDLFG